MHKMKALLSSVDVKGLKDAADNFCQLDWAFRILSTRNCPSLMQLGMLKPLQGPLLAWMDGGLTLYTLIAGIIYAWTGFEKDATEQSWIWQMVQPKKKCWRRESLWLFFWGYFTTFDILDTVVYRCKGKVDLEWENSTFGIHAFSLLPGECWQHLVKKSSSSSNGSICPPTARKHGFYGQVGTL